MRKREFLIRILKDFSWSLLLCISCIILLKLWWPIEPKFSRLLFYEHVEIHQVRILVFDNCLMFGSYQSLSQRRNYLNVVYLSDDTCMLSSSNFWPPKLLLFFVFISGKGFVFPHRKPLLVLEMIGYWSKSLLIIPDTLKSKWVNSI